MFEVGEFDLIGPQEIYDVAKNVWLMRDRLMMAHSRQKSYATNRKKDL